MAARSSIWKRQMKAKLMGGRAAVPCCFCRRKLSAATATIEHVKPLSLGGGWGMKNLALSCHACNQERGVIEFEAFRAMKRS